MQAKGFFGSLFDYSFSSFVTPRIIKVLYVLATILISLWTLFLVAAAFNVSEGAGAVTLIVFGPLFFVLSMIYARVFLELVIVFFRINGNVQEIRDEHLGGAPQPAPTPEPPPEVAPAVAPRRGTSTDRAGAECHRKPRGAEPGCRDSRRDAVRAGTRARAADDALLRELRRRATPRRALLHCLRPRMTKLLTCASCGNQEPEGARFCGSCGAVFVPADQPAVRADTRSARLVTCASCGNEEPVGSRFCGSCSAPLTPSRAVLAPGARPRPTPASPGTGVSGFAPPPSPSGGGEAPAVGRGGCGRRAARGGGRSAALLLASDGDGSTQATPTAQPPPPATTSPAAADAVEPDAGGEHRSPALRRSPPLRAAQRSRRLAQGGHGVLRGAARGCGALAASVARAQESSTVLLRADSTEAATLELLRAPLRPTSPTRKRSPVSLRCRGLSRGTGARGDRSRRGGRSRLCEARVRRPGAAEPLLSASTTLA